MNQIQINSKGKTYNFTLSSTWEELSGSKQWRALSPHLEDNDYYNRDAIKALILKGKFPGERHIPSQGYLPLYNCLDFLMDHPCVYPPIKSFMIGYRLQLFHLPAPRLENISIIEFAFLDMCWELNRFFRGRGEVEKAEEWLTKLCMYMARPIDKRIDPKDPETYMGDRREKFNTGVIDPRWELFQKIRQSDRFACIWFFLGCKRYIHQRYKGKLWFDTHDSEGREIIGVQKDDKPQPFRWIEIIRKLAGGKFGNLKETQFTGLYDVLEELVVQAGK
jgi:hypothetical protein